MPADGIRSGGSPRADRNNPEPPFPPDPAEPDRPMEPAPERTVEPEPEDWLAPKPPRPAKDWLAPEPPPAPIAPPPPTPVSPPPAAAPAPAPVARPVAPAPAPAAAPSPSPVRTPQAVEPEDEDQELEPEPSFADRLRRIPPALVILGLAAVGSTGFMLVEVLSRSAPVQALTAGALVMGLSYVLVTVVCVLATYRSANEGRPGLAFLLAFIGGCASIMAFASFAGALIMFMALGF